MKNNTRGLLSVLLAAATAVGTTAFGQDKIADTPLAVKAERAFANLDFNRPIVITHAGDGTNRVFVAEQEGIIKVFANDQETEESSVFLDIDDRCVYADNQNEEGLLGFAFHPEFRTNGEFFVYYTSSDEDHLSKVSRFRVSRDNPNVADAASEEEILRIPQPFWNHNGGTIEFGPDGYLYIALGDGGSGNDRYYVDEAGDVVNEAVGEGTLDLVYSTVDYTLAAGQEIERLYSNGTNTGLSLTGNEFNNLISGGDGNDILIGGAGSDMIYGNAGTDRIVGGSGIDTLFGNVGADVFVLTPTYADRDVIRDFEAADQLEVSASLFGGGLAAGSLGANQFTSNGTGVASTTDQRFIYNNTNGVLYFDADGSGATARVQIATLTGVPGLTAIDFTVVG